LPLACSLLELFEGYFDFMGTPKSKYFFEKMLPWATVSHEKEKLEEFVSPEGQVSFLYLWE
jgi:hypothetical protein